jgi:hypothetical protein
MSTKHHVVTPYVLTFGVQTRPYQLAAMERLRVSHHGAVMVRVYRNAGTSLASLPLPACWALPADEALWVDGQRLYQMYQHTVDDLAGHPPCAGYLRTGTRAASHRQRIGILR